VQNISTFHKPLFGKGTHLVAPYGFWTLPKTPEFGAEYGILPEFCQNMCQLEHQNVLFAAGTGIRISNLPITVTL